MPSRRLSRSFAWHQAKLEELRPSIIQNRWILRWFSDHCAARVLIQLGQVLVRFHAKGQYLRACWCWLCCCCCPLVWGLNVSLGRYGKAWQSPDITLLLMLDIFTSSQSAPPNSKDLNAEKSWDTLWLRCEQKLDGGETKEIMAPLPEHPLRTTHFSELKRHLQLGLI